MILIIRAPDEATADAFPGDRVVSGRLVAPYPVEAEEVPEGWAHVLTTCHCTPAEYLTEPDLEPDVRAILEALAAL